MGIILLIGLVSAGVFYFSYKRSEVETEGTTISEFEYNEYQYPDKSDDGDTGETEATIKGYLACTLSADEWQKNTFVVDESDLDDLSVPADKSEGISPGSEIRFKGGISVITAPTDEGVYYVDYDVMKRYHNFYETGKYETGATRHYAYYEIASDGAWDERNVPFRVKVKDAETGETISGWNKYVVGPQGNQDQISLAEGIELEKIGQLDTGMGWPGTEYVYGTRVKNGSLESNWFNKSTFQTNLGGISGTTLNNIRIDEGGVSCDAGNDYIVINQSDDVKAETTGPVINNGANRFQLKDSGDELSSVWSWTVDEGHQDLDLTIPLNVNASGLNPSDVSVDMTYTNNPQNDSPSEHFHWRDKDPSDGKIKIKLDEDGWWGTNSNPTIEVTFNFKPGIIDTLSEFSHLTNLSETNVDSTPSRHIATSSSELVSSNLNLWIPQSLYSNTDAELPETSYSDTSLDNPVAWTTNHTGSPIVQLKAPLDKFDAVLVTPQYTNPDVTSISPDPLKLTGGEEKQVDVEVTNNGYTDGSMNVSYSTPSWAYVSSGPETISVKKGETKIFTYSITSTAMKEKKASNISFTFTGSESDETGSDSFTVESNPPTHTITTEVVPAGSGSISLNPEQDEYVEGKTVTIEAIPSGGASFTEWGGDISKTDPNPTDITVNSDLKVTAYFGTTNPGYSLDTHVEPSAGGSISVNPSQSSYESGTEVTLTAEPSVGYNFVNWTGDVEDVDKQVTITIENYTELTANFEEEEGGNTGSLEVTATTLAGEPVYNATVRCGGVTGYTDRTGEAKLAGISEGSNTLAVSKEGYASYSTPVTIKAGEPITKNVNIPKKKEELPWMIIILVVAVAVAVIVPLVVWWKLG